MMQRRKATYPSQVKQNGNGTSKKEQTAAEYEEYRKEQEQPEEQPDVVLSEEDQVDIVTNDEDPTMVVFHLSLIHI